MRSLGQSVSSGFTWIGVKNKVWNLHHEGETHIFMRDDGTPSSFIDVVVLAENPHQSKLYYIGVYQEGANQPPDCASIDGIKPDPGVPSPQNKVCGTCRHNAFGTAPNGGRGKACQDHIRTAVLLLPYMTKKIMGGKPLIAPVFLKIPPDSLKSWKAYGESLQHRGAPPEAVITRISFAPDKLFRMVFTMQQALTDAEAPVILPLLEDRQTLSIIGNFAAPVPALPPVEEHEEAEDNTIQDTGLAEAFGTTAPTQTQTAQPATGTRKGRTPKPKPAAAPNLFANGDDGDGEGGGGDDGDAELHARVKNLTAGKLQNMLK